MAEAQRKLKRFSARSTSPRDSGIYTRHQKVGLNEVGSQQGAKADVDLAGFYIPDSRAGLSIGSIATSPVAHLKTCEVFRYLT